MRELILLPRPPACATEAASARRRPAAAPARFGEWCVHEGLATPDQVREALQLQRLHRMAGQPVPRLGEILVELGCLSPAHVARILARQGRLEPLPEEVELAARHAENLFGRYILLRQVGRGGFGTIFLAWDTLRGRRVAVKRVRADRLPGDTAGEDAIDGLAREARHAIPLRHPGIVGILDVGREGKDHYLAMEYVEGMSLDDDLILARMEGRISPWHRDPERVLRVLAEAARALHYAHTNPWAVAHGDVKPGNIMVDLQGHAHLLDFGLARRLGVEAPRELEVCGTPNYMAPEQATGRVWEIDARTDAYGLGAVLYEMLAGRPPFVGQPLAILLQVAKEAPRRPSELLDRPFPRALEDLCMACLEKDKSRRPADLLQIAEILEAN